MTAPGPRRRAPWLAAGLVALLVGLLAGCGAREEAPTDPSWWVERAEAAEAAGDPDRAAHAWTTAFALTSPVAGQALRRAQLALAAARALRQAGRPDRALTWVRQVESLAPTHVEALLERGLLLDGTWPETADPRAAAAALARYLAVWESLPEDARDEANGALARRRLEAVEAWLDELDAAPPEESQTR